MIRRRYCIHQVFAHCLLWPWHLTPKSISIATNPYRSVTKIGWNCLHWFGVVHLLWPWTLTLKSNQHVYKPKYICDQNWAKFPSLVFTVWLHVMQRMLLLSQFRPSVRCVYCDKTKWGTADILIPHERQSL